MAEKIISARLPFLEIKKFPKRHKYFERNCFFFEILKILFKTKPDIVHVSSSKAGGMAGVAILAYSVIKRQSLLFS